MFYEVLGDEPVSAEKKAAIQEILVSNKAKKNIICTSVITHLEVIPQKLTQKDADDEKDYLSLFDHEHFLDIEISANVLLLAREIRDYYFRPADAAGSGGKMMDTADAIHLATAIINGVDEFHTRDNQTKGSKVPLVSLYEWSQKPRICEKYNLKIVSPESEQGIFDLSGGNVAQDTKH